MAIQKRVATRDAAPEDATAQTERRQGYEEKSRQPMRATGEPAVAPCATRNNLEVAAEPHNRLDDAICSVKQCAALTRRLTLQALGR